MLNIEILNSTEKFRVSLQEKYTILWFSPFINLTKNGKTYIGEKEYLSEKLGKSEINDRGWKINYFPKIFSNNIFIYQDSEKVLLNV